MANGVATVTNSKGASVVSHFTFAISSGQTQDGSALAPPGTAQFPHLLDLNSPGTQTFGSTYLGRPSWKVAGVDYHVGIDRNLYPTNGSLADPLNGAANDVCAALAALGCTYVAPVSGVTIQKVVINNNSITVEGYDFSLHSGIRLACSSNFTGLIIRNNNFVNPLDPTGSESALQISGSNCTITKNEIDGGGRLGSVGRALLEINAYGPLTFTYNTITNAWAENILYVSRIASDPSGVIVTFKYNLVTNGGRGEVTDPGSGVHGDWFVQSNGNGPDPVGVMDNGIFTYNTWIQQEGVGAGQGLTFPSRGKVAAQTWSNNVVCLPGTGGTQINWPCIVELTYLSGTCSADFNYGDGKGPAAVGGSFGNLLDTSSGGGGGPFSGTITWGTHNIDLNSGAALATSGTKAT